MRRRKRFTILRIAVGLAVAATFPVTALAKPVPANQDVVDHGQYQLGPGEIPYLDLGGNGKSSDDRAVSRATPHGVEVASVAKSPDDRSFSRATPVDTTPVVVSDGDGRSIDFNPYTVTGFVLALLMALGLGMGIAVWHSRRTHLSPA